MIKPNNVTTGILVFIMFIGLFVSAYTSLEDKYGVEKDTTGIPDCDPTQSNCNSTQSIGEALESLVVITGITKITTAAQVFAVPGNILIQSFEVLTGAGLGIIIIFLGLMILPGNIMNVLLQYYYMPPIFALTIAVFFNVYIAFILVRYLLKME